MPSAPRHSWLALVLTAVTVVSLAPSAAPQAQMVIPPLAANPQLIARYTHQMIRALGPESTGQQLVYRKMIADALDQIVDVPADPRQHPLRDPVLGPFIGHLFRFRMLDVLHRIATEPPPPTGVRVYKLYSSSFVLKSNDVTFAVDFAPGPFALANLPGWTVKEIGQLAEHLDGYFISHIHGDHFSIVLMAEMIARGKLVVATREMRQVLMGNGFTWAREIQVPAPRMGQIFLGIGTFVFVGHQYSVFHNGDPRMPDTSAYAPENNVYIFRVGGKTFAHFGDNNDPEVSPWLTKFLGLGGRVDVLLQAGPLGQQLVRRLSPTFALNSHDWEFTHAAGGFIPLSMPLVPDPLHTVLMWGESKDFP